MNADRLSLLDLAWIRWWRMRDWFHRCPDCRRRGWGGWDGSAPRWEDDQTALMLGIARFGCPCCGKGAIAARDASGAACWWLLLAPAAMVVVGYVGAWVR